jgi:hypothetical protein
MNVSAPCIYSLHPASSNWISPLYGTPRSTRECSSTSQPSLWIFKSFRKQPNTPKDYNKYCMQHLECQKLCDFSQSVTNMGFSVNFWIVISIVKEAKNVKRSVTFPYVTIERHEKLFSSRPVVCYSGSNVKMKLNYDIRSHYEVSENWMHTVLKLRYKCLLATSCSCNGRVWHSCTKEGIFSAVSPEFPYFHFSIPLVNRVK